MRRRLYDVHDRRPTSRGGDGEVERPRERGDSSETGSADAVASAWASAGLPGAAAAVAAAPDGDPLPSMAARKASPCVEMTSVPSSEGGAEARGERRGGASADMTAASKQARYAGLSRLRAAATAEWQATAGMRGDGLWISSDGCASGADDGRCAKTAWPRCGLMCWMMYGR